MRPIDRLESFFVTFCIARIVLTITWVLGSIEVSSLPAHCLSRLPPRCDTSEVGGGLGSVYSVMGVQTKIFR